VLFTALLHLHQQRSQRGISQKILASLTITVSKENEVSISATFEDIGNLKKFDEALDKFVVELREAFDFLENNKSSVCVFSYQRDTAVDTLELN